MTSRKLTHGGRHLPRPASNTSRSLILQEGIATWCQPAEYAGDVGHTPPLSPVVTDGKMYARGASDMQSGTIGALYAVDAIKAAGLKPTGRIHFQS